MSLWGDIFGGAVNGAVASATNTLGGRDFPGLCAQLGWGIDARLDEAAFGLDFTGGRFGTRQVVVVWGENVTLFSLRSAAEFRPAALPAELGWVLLARNKEAAFVSWHLTETDGGRAGFVATFTALTAGLTAPVLKVICQKLCEEVNAVDGGLRDKGLI